MDANTRFEIIAELYRRHSGRLAPGKDSPMAASQSDQERSENHLSWTGWIHSDLVLEGALAWIEQLQEENERLRRVL